MGQHALLIGAVTVLLLVPRLGASDPAAAPADRAAAVQGNNAFALDLYAQLRGAKGNLFFSPSSISTALAMTSAGARGETADEMTKTLHLTLSPQRLHPALAGLLRDLNGSGKQRPYQLSVANALWCQKGYPFRADFLKLIRDNYGAGLNAVDFVADTEAARQAINDWVEKQTQDKIKDLLQRGVLKSNTRLVLTNAIYFKGNWVRRFAKDQTHDEDFHVTGQEKTRVPLMRQDGAFSYFKGDGFQALELPYDGKDLSMVVFLPERLDGLPEFEKTLTGAKLDDWVGKLRRAEQVHVWLPRFKLTQQFRLKDTLQALGMRRAFQPGVADFSGITDRPDELCIGDVVHKAFVDVNEEGTEAAAATGVVISVMAARVDNPKPVVFRADHPFVFVIRDNRSGNLLFLGRVSNPTS